MRPRYLFVLSALLLVAGSPLYADPPEWTQRLPFTDDAFWGVGTASSLEEAQALARQEILMQMSSHVKAVVSIESKSNGGTLQASEDLDAFFARNSLRGAELVEEFSEGGDYWVLMKYCDDCGNSLLKSALNRFEEEFGYDSTTVMEKIVDERLSRAVQVEQRLKELELEDFKGDDILVRFSDMQVMIMIINFIPYETNLSSRQIQGLDAIAASLLEELTALDYRSIEIIGHANPVGEAGEDAELDRLSRNRAETLSNRLTAAGLTVDSVSWRGGRELIGDTDTAEGKGLNRRVEIVVNFQ